MPLANPETCTHPFTRCESPHFGATRCKRCGADTTPAKRSFEHRAGPRTTFARGDRIHVKASEITHSFKGVWLYADDEPSGLVYCVAEKQIYQLDKRSFEGTAAIRFIRPEHVRHDDGVRARRRREEEAA
jgi:hypothetical protein